MKPIETRYKGYRFRSRLEARWAVFFDSLGLDWEYEPEGFDLDAGYYLPDFKVIYPGRWEDERHTEWFEVKGDLTQVTQNEWARLFEFDSRTGITILDGTPSPKMYGTPRGLLKHKYPDGAVGYWQGNESSVVVRPFELHNDALAKDRFGVALWSGKGRLWWDEYENYFAPTTDFGYSSEIEDACVAARSARFEFGESGARV